MKLHYSQTVERTRSQGLCFSTLWNYTTLKPSLDIVQFIGGFSTLWNYTTLKHNRRCSAIICCFSTLWNYTTLKLIDRVPLLRKVSVPYEITLLSNNKKQTIQISHSFSTLWNYTTLKPTSNRLVYAEVSVPYEITLLSNHCSLV